MTAPSGAPGTVLFLRGVPSDEATVWLCESYDEVSAWMQSAAPDDAREFTVWRVTTSYPMTVERRAMVRVQPYD